jgi:hypothetical protein
MRSGVTLWTPKVSGRSAPRAYPFFSQPESYSNESGFLFDSVIAKQPILIFLDW